MLWICLHHTYCVYGTCKQNKYKKEVMSLDEIVGIRFQNTVILTVSRVPDKRIYIYLWNQTNTGQSNCYSTFKKDWRKPCFISTNRLWVKCFNQCFYFNAYVDMLVNRLFSQSKVLDCSGISQMTNTTNNRSKTKSPKGRHTFEVKRNMKYLQSLWV